MDLDELRQRSHEQVVAYERTNGRSASVNRMGYPVVIVTSIGARSGAVRKFPVIRVEREGQYLVVASLGGEPMNPNWYHNVIAHPRVSLQDGAVRREYTARELSGAERAAWWPIAVEDFPPYAEYQARTDRVIPILLLTPLDPVDQPATAVAPG